MEEDPSPHAEELERTKSQLMVFAREIGAVYQRERRQARQLDGLVGELRDEYLQVIQTLALVVEAKDEYTRYHLERCNDYATALAKWMNPSMLTPELQYGFLLHDVGKIGIPESILSKPGPLTAAEMRVMQTHPLLGVQIVGPMMRALDDSTIQVIRHHHERYDGNGYPDKLAGKQIPVAARIFSVVDAFDAMTTDRPYRKAMVWEEALLRIQQGAGTQFDPEAVLAFGEVVDKLQTTSTQE
ncbi:MAG: HD-GYP domain-containing protein [Actinomycetota bacterium]